MKSNTINQKTKIDCPICHKKDLVKQYISYHMKRKHPESQYSKLIKRGMKLKLKQYILLPIKDNDYFCNICQKTINKSSIYMHNKTVLHKILLHNQVKESEIQSQILKKFPNEKNIEKSITGNNIENVVHKNALNFNQIEKLNNNFICDAINDTINEKDFTNGIKLNLSFSNSLKENKELYSIFDSSHKSKSSLLNKNNNNQVFYSRISDGLIPKNFITTNSIKIIEEFDKSSIKDYNEKDDSINDNSKSDESISSSFSKDENIRIYESDIIMEPGEMKIKRKIDEICERIINKKRRRRSSKKAKIIKKNKQYLKKQ